MKISNITLKNLPHNKRNDEYYQNKEPLFGKRLSGAYHYDKINQM